MDIEKLIKLLRYCATTYTMYDCSKCVRDNNGQCDEELMSQAADALEKLQVKLARVTAERDGAVHDLEEIMFKGGHNIDTCHFCTNGQCYGRGGTQCCEPKWRGIKED